MNPVASLGKEDSVLSGAAVDLQNMASRRKPGQHMIPDPLSFILYDGIISVQIIEYQGLFVERASRFLFIGILNSRMYINFFQAHAIFFFQERQMACNTARIMLCAEWLG